jgi:ABC-type lipoprotein export system ATPase subunit
VAVTFELQGVGFSYPLPPERKGGKAELFEVLKDVTLTIPKGSRVALLGKSGVGKSTLVSLLGLLTGTKSFQGRITYTDSQGQARDYQTLPQTTAEHLRRTEFGYALQSSYLLPHLSVVENLGIPLGLSGQDKTQRERQARDLLELTDLSQAADSIPSRLSGGQKQRVGVLRSLIHDPTVVFADEPFSALDDENKYKILDLLARWQDADDKRTLIMVCHDRRVAEHYKADVLYMEENFRVDFPWNPLAPSR